MRPLTWASLGVLTLAVLALARIEVPTDLGSWVQGPLAGQIVLTMRAQGESVLVGTRAGLYRLDPDGSEHDLGVDGPVNALAVDAAGQLWAGTDRGVEPVDPDPQALPSLTDGPVHALGVQGTALIAGGASGAHRLRPQGDWELVWPVGGSGSAPVGAVVGTPAGILFSHPDGLALLHHDGQVEMVLPEVDVVALGRWDDTGDVWVGTRGAPLLLTSSDDGLTWSERSEGLGYNAVHAVVWDPADPARLVSGGSGLADGTGNAGTQLTEDGGLTWQVEQDRLSNTHVYALAATTEPVRLGLRVAGTDRGTTIPLPSTTTRWYAGTNGAGVATSRPAVPVLDTLAATTPYLRLAEPLLGGVLLVAMLVAAYHQLTSTRTTAPRGPPVPRPDGPSTPSSAPSGRTRPDPPTPGEN
ncbi:hypothetical protein ACI3ET_00385 [Ornithinimicrobium sp. LYQ121]|uniref:hypothetical protein n=1 Tax=Ornithinimicrobium sp. LYQ121 TaxID=3378801 RepID=UPI0038534511